MAKLLSDSEVGFGYFSENNLLIKLYRVDYDGGTKEMR